MVLRISTALILVLVFSPIALAQTVRFDTNVGNIDLILNPENNGNLQLHVQNILRYVNAGRYDGVVINRADTGQDPNDPADDFVLQFGGFTTASPILPADFTGFSRVRSFDPVIVDFDGDGSVDFDTTELTNTRSTVTLALSGPPNTGANSFFVNSTDNSFLDARGFVPFAIVQDMSTIDYIMRVNQMFITDPSAPLNDLDANGASTASRNIPVINTDNFLVIVKRAFCLNCDTFTPSAAPAVSALTASGDSSVPETSGMSLPAESSLQVASIPEPPALVLVVGAIMLLAVLKPTRLRY